MPGDHVEEVGHELLAFVRLEEAPVDAVQPAETVELDHDPAQNLTQDLGVSCGGSGSCLEVCERTIDRIDARTREQSVPLRYGITPTFENRLSRQAWLLAV
jgi:hypothetical protein